MKSRPTSPTEWILAPRRSLRLVMFTFFCVSATVGAVIATVQVVSALRGAPDALPLNDVATVSFLT